MRVVPAGLLSGGLAKKKHTATNSIAGTCHRGAEGGRGEGGTECSSDTLDYIESVSHVLGGAWITIPLELI